MDAAVNNGNEVNVDREYQRAIDKFSEGRTANILGDDNTKSVR